MEPGHFGADVVQRDHYRFDVTFDDETWAPILVDEPEPLGEGAGPSASRLLAAAVGNCLAASLLFCLEKARVELSDLSAHVEGTMERNEEGRLRIAEMNVTLRPRVEGEPSKRYDRCLDLFEDFCVVTQSVRAGIDVDVRVEPTFASGASASTRAQPEPAGSD